MKKIYFTVGPSQVYPTFEKHLLRAVKENIPSISHRGTQFKEIFASTAEGLKKLMNMFLVAAFYLPCAALPTAMTLL